MGVLFLADWGFQGYWLLGYFHYFPYFVRAELHSGADFFTAAFNSLRPGGRYTICGATTGLRVELHLGLLFTRQIEIYGGFMGSKEDMREIVAMLNRGAIRPAIHQSYPLTEAAAAHQSMEDTNFFGKLLLKP